MEADWEIEIGGDAPVAPIIDAYWSGFVDLRLEPRRATTLPEVSGLPALANALLRLNASGSPVWTSKCDVWEEDSFEPDELDAAPDNSAFALACYIDILPTADQEWRLHEQTVASCRMLCRHLRDVTLCNCRADLIVRRATVASDLPKHGVTVYLTACGSTLEEARTTLAAALVALVDSILSVGHFAADSSTLK